MRLLAHSVVLGLSTLALACGSGYTTPKPPAASSVLGSYELALTAQGTGAKVATLRLDLTKVSVEVDAGVAPTTEVRAWVQENGVVHPLDKPIIEEGSVGLSFVGRRPAPNGGFEETGDSLTLVIARGADGRLTTATGERKQGTGPSVKVEGTVGRDTTPPSLLASEPALPWEVGAIRLSEAVLPTDLALPPVAGLTLTPFVVPSSPWHGGFDVKTSAWDGIPDPIAGLMAADPSGNRATLSATGTFAKVGPAVATYDFDRDEPAWKSPSVTRVEKECEKGSCLLFQSGERVALRFAGGKKSVSVRLRAYTAKANATSLPLTLSVAPKGDAAIEKAGIEVAFTRLDAPPGVDKAFATAVFDVPLPLPAASELGVTLSLPKTTDLDGAPFFVALEGATTE